MPSPRRGTAPVPTSQPRLGQIYRRCVSVECNASDQRTGCQEVHEPLIGILLCFTAAKTGGGKWEQGRHVFMRRIPLQLFHTGCTQPRTIFAMTQHFTKLGETPFWHLWVPKGAEMTSLRGAFRTLTCRLSQFAMAATV